jgi:hypothetical protein
MKRIHLQKIASVTSRLNLRPQAILPAVAGTVVAARVLTTRRNYNSIENPQGRQVPLRPGDVIAGALGFRHALHGFAGVVPEKVSVGDKLQLLNLGGVIGQSVGDVPLLGHPFDVEILGAILDFPIGNRSQGVAASIDAYSLANAPMPIDLPPIVALVGTSMDTGKTTASSALVSGLSDQGLNVACGKLTGVSLRRDMLMQEDNGASITANFTDFGLVTTNEETVVEAAHSLISFLNDHAPDVIVLELGDGLFGPYGVRALLADQEFQNAIQAYFLCAHDPVGAWGAVRDLDESFGIRPTIVTGPITDTPVGVGFCRDSLDLPAANALLNPAGLVAPVAALLQEVQV